MCVLKVRVIDARSAKREHGRLRSAEVLKDNSQQKAALSVCLYVPLCLWLCLCLSVGMSLCLARSLSHSLSRSRARQGKREQERLRTAEVLKDNTRAVFTRTW